MDGPTAYWRRQKPGWSLFASGKQTEFLAIRQTPRSAAGPRLLKEVSIRNYLSTQCIEASSAADRPQTETDTMARADVLPTGKEVFFDESDIIVSKTDLKGKITYANDVFLSIAGYSESEVVGAPHNMIRHPEMPRTVFELLWGELKTGREIFAYVKNMTKAGDHYWVLAHVTPSRGESGSIVGYHSNRRVPQRDAIGKVDALYRSMRVAEQTAPGPREALLAGRSVLDKALASAGKPYNSFVFAL